MAAKFSVRVDPRRCKSCELCAAVCPKKIMVITHERNDLGFHVAACSDASACTGCLACALVCPDVAVEIVEEPGK